MLSGYRQNNSDINRVSHSFLLMTNPHLIQLYCHIFIHVEPWFAVLIFISRRPKRCELKKCIAQIARNDNILMDYVICSQGILIKTCYEVHKCGYGAYRVG